MGSAQPGSKNVTSPNWGSATLHIANDSYTPGDTLKAEVNFESNSKIDQEDQELTLKFTGIEADEYPFKDLKRGPIIATFSGTRPLLQEQPSGVYKAEFSFLIPKESLEKYDKEFEFGPLEITYMVKVEIISEKYPQTPIKIEKPVTVRVNAPVDMPIAGINSTNQEHIITCFGRSDPVRAFFRMRSDKTEYNQGEEAIIYAEIDNSRNTLGISSLKCSLICCLYYRTGDKTEAISEKCSEISHSILNDVIGPGEIAMGPNQKVIRIPVLAQKPAEEVLNAENVLGNVEPVYKVCFEVEYTGFGTSIKATNRSFDLILEILPLASEKEELLPNEKPKAYQ